MGAWAGEGTARKYESARRKKHSHATDPVGLDIGSLKAQEAAERERIEREQARGSMQALLDSYVGYLRRSAKQSHRDVKSIFKKNVLDPWPQFAGMRAADIQAAHITPMLRKLVDAGKGRTAGKLLSYLRSAFALAARAE